jgi:hypothetical protein
MAAAGPRSDTTDWGTPDPRDAGAYPEPTSATLMPIWAWEFLRRRDDYRRRWLKVTNDRGIKEECATEHGREIRWRSAAEVLREEFRICASGANATPTLRSTRA